MVLDSNLFNFIYSFSGQSRVLDWFGVFFAQYMPIIFIGLVLYFLVREGTWRKKIERFLLLGLTFILSYGIFGGILHFFIGRNRPFVDLNFTPLFTESGNAFPSRHAIILFSIAILIFMFNKRVGWWLFFFAILNGIARVFVGVHWPSDIVGGAIIGILSYFIAWYILKPYFTKNHLLKEKLEPTLDDVIKRKQ